MAGKTGYFEAHNITWLYYWRAANLINLQFYYLENCEAVGCGASGFLNNRSNGIERNCRSLSNSADGFQSFGIGGTAPSGYRDHISARENCYAALNGDDGMSEHARCNMVFSGYNASEYNEDNGVAGVEGADYQNTGDLYVLNNGQGRGLAENSGFAAPNGDGVGIRANPPGTEGGVGTSFSGGRVIAKGNATNFACTVSAGFMRLVDAVSLDPWDKSTGAAGTHFRQASGGTLELIDARHSGAGTVKSGTPTVVTTTALT